jgi:hypothetical protein
LPAGARQDTSGVAPGPGTTTGPAPRTGRVRVWPEVPLPARPGHTLTFRDSLAAPSYPVLQRKWLLGAGLGYRHCWTDFRQFFTDMGQVEFLVLHPMTRVLTPYFSFQVGFGNIQSQIEQVTANGRSELYALELGTRARVPTGRHGELYLGAGGGYYMRSLRWGGLFIGTDNSGQSFLVDSPVLEVKTWGGAARLGWQKQLPRRGGKPLLLDFQLRWELYAKATMGLAGLNTAGDTIQYLASGRDQWIGFSIGAIFGF